MPDPKFPIANAEKKPMTHAEHKQSFYERQLAELIKDPRRFQNDAIGKLPKERVDGEAWIEKARQLTSKEPADFIAQDDNDLSTALNYISSYGKDIEMSMALFYRCALSIQMQLPKIMSLTLNTPLDKTELKEKCISLSMELAHELQKYVYFSSMEIEEQKLRLVIAALAFIVEFEALEPNDDDLYLPHCQKFISTSKEIFEQWVPPGHDVRELILPWYTKIKEKYSKK